MMGTVGAILAGGASSRMGTDKALISLGGRPMIEHVATALRDASLDVIVVGRGASTVDAPHVPDPDGMTGPAAGLLAALEWTSGREVFLIGVDQPFARPDSIRRLLESSGGPISVPVDEGHPQVTFARYGPGSLRHASELLAREPSASLQAIVDIAGAVRIGREVWSGWGEDGSSWWSIDSPRDLARAELRIGAQLRSDP